MTEKHWVLGLLVRHGPASPAELKRWLSERSGLIGPTDGLVSTSLAELVAEGSIEGTGELRGEEAERSRDRVVYAATLEGEAEFDDWMHRPVAPEQDILELLPDTSWLPEEISGPEEVEALIEEAARREAEIRAQLGDNRLVPSEEMDRDRPWPEIARDLVHNSEVLRLEGHAQGLAGAQSLLREFLAEMRT